MDELLSNAVMLCCIKHDAVLVYSDCDDLQTADDLMSEDVLNLHFFGEKSSNLQMIVITEQMDLQSAMSMATSCM